MCLAAPSGSVDLQGQQFRTRSLAAPYAVNSSSTCPVLFESQPCSLPAISTRVCQHDDASAINWAKILCVGVTSTPCGIGVKSYALPVTTLKGAAGACPS